MRQVSILNIPPTSDVPAFLEWVKQALEDITNASAENVFEPETLDVYAKIASPTFTGTPAAPTPSPGDNDTSIATTEFVTDAVADEATARADADAAEVTARDNAIAAAIATIPAPSYVDFISGFIPAVTNQDYMLVVNVPRGLTIDSVTTISTGGTATATFKINSTALGGSANSISAAEVTQAHASANVAAVGDDIVMTISANASCVNITFTIKFTWAP